MTILQSFYQLLQACELRFAVTRELNWCLLPLSTASRTRSAFEGNPPPSHLVFVSIYQRQFCHKQQRPNNTIHLFNFYKSRSVLRFLAGSVSPVHLLSISKKSSSQHPCDLQSVTHVSKHWITTLSVCNKSPVTRGNTHIRYLLFIHRFMTLCVFHRRDNNSSCVPVVGHVLVLRQKKHFGSHRFG